MRMIVAVQRVVIAVALAGLVLAPSGCSYAVSQPPPARPLRWDGECSTSRLPVVGDVYMAVNTGALALLGLMGAGVVANRRSTDTVPSWDTESDTTATATTLLVVGAVGAAATVGLIKSANYGLDSARACDAARAALFQQQTWYPPRWTPPGYPPQPAYPPPAYPVYPPPPAVSPPAPSPPGVPPSSPPSSPPAP